MKKIFTLLALLSLSLYVYPQYVVFHENFDGNSAADSVTSVPSAAWALSGQLFASPAKSDSAIVVQNDTSFLITDAFSTSGKSNVLLEFDQICKVEFSDAAEILVSVNNGQTWTQLTAPYYLGSGQFGNFNNRFSAASYAVDWDAANPYTIPQNSWWKHEIFDISALAANATQVKIMFRLRDGNNNGPGNNYGWLIDNIKVQAAVGELIPPVLSLLPPVLEDSVFSTGPFNIYAQASDASGIDTVIIYYSRNNGALDTLGMTHMYGNVFYAKIDTVPAFAIGDSLCYYIKAVDNSPISNEARYPSNSCTKFKIYSSPPPPGCTTPITAFPYSESFDTNFIAGAGYPSAPGVLGSGWSRTPATGNTFMWLVNSGTTNSSGTGPTGDHTTGSGNYLYTESSYGSNQQTAILEMPCVDLTQIDVPFLEFYYHMFGQQMGELHVDIYYGGQWQYDIFPAIIGNQGMDWHRARINLSNYKSSTKIRFRAVRAGSYTGDIAIDDVKIWQPPAYDVAALSVDAPASPATVAAHPVKVSFRNEGSEILHKLTINWQVNQQTQTPFSWTGLLMPGQKADSVTIGQYNFNTGPVSIKFWTSMPNDSVDVNPSNDTALGTIIACASALRGTFVVGGNNPDFMTLNDALFAIENCGIDSAIVFEIAPGTYTEQLDIDPIPGANDTNTVTFRSQNGDSTSVVLQYAPSSTADNYIVRFKGAEHIIFSGISCISTAAQYGRIFVFENDASHITVAHCRIECPQIFSSYAAGIYSSNTHSNYLRILNNDIKRGYYSIYLRGDYSTHVKGNRVENNYCHDFRSYGAYLMYQDSVWVNGNTFISDTTSSFIYGVYLYYLGGYYEVQGNRIVTQASSSNTALRLYFCSSTGANRALIANNMVACKGTANAPIGLMGYSVSNTDFYYNSFQIDSGATATSRALYISYGSGVRMKNNIFSNFSDGYTIYISSPAAIASSDYNDFYSAGSNFAFWSGNVSSFTAYKSASGKDAHSINLQPDFVSPENLHIKNGAMSFKGTYIPSVLYDIDGDIRDTLAPAIGADEKMRIPVDVGVRAVLSPVSPLVQGDTVQVKIVLNNFGLDTAPAFTYSYLLNSNIQGPVQNHSAGMPPGSTDTLTFPDITVGAAQNNICAYTILTSDTNTYNDTLCRNFYVTPLTDLGVSDLVKPDSGNCFSTNQDIQVKIKNYGALNVNLSSKPLTIKVQVDNGSTQNIFSRTLTAGLINSGQEWLVTVSSNLNMAATGTYTFKAWTEIQGDGDAANDTLPERSIDVFATITQLPYKQDFENFIPSGGSGDPGSIGEGWAIFNPTGNIEWYVGSGQTPTTGTGPAVDHTNGTPGGKYMYTEATSYSSAYTLFASPCIDISSAQHPVLRFWYHAYGNNINSLKVDVFSGGVWHYQVFKIYGHHQNSETDPWKQAVVDLSNFSGPIRIRFSVMKSSGYLSDLAIDDVEVLDPQAHDAGISQYFVLPSNNFANTGTVVPVKVRIENLGLDTLTSLKVGYMAGNAVPVLEKWTGNILPFQSEEYEFNTKLTAPVGEVNICAYTRLNGDMNQSNDTACRSFTGIPSFPVPFSDDFEGTSFFVGDGGNQQWVKGVPGKNIFNAAHSPVNAWMTDLHANYMNNSHDYLYTPYFDFTIVPNCTLSFYHRLDCQPGADGGYVEYSINQGATWITLGYMGDPLAANWYDANNNGNHFWSGVDVGWRHSTYDLSAFNGYNSVQFRFVFISDANTNGYEGWMIDDFSIQPPAIPKDAGIVAILTPAAYTQPGSNIQLKLRIKNYGTQTLTSIPLYYRIDNNTAVPAVWTGSLAPGATTDYTFSTSYTAPAKYRLKAGTMLSADTYGFNDTISVFMNLDVALTSIFQPASQEIVGDSMHVAVSLQNFGTDTLYSLNLEYDDQSGNTHMGNWIGVLPPGGSAIYYFPDYYHVYYGISQICARVLMSGDTKQTNNEVCQYTTGVVGLSPVEDTDFSLYQNSPNPFNKRTEIAFDLPYGGNVQFRVMDIFGRIVYQKQIVAHRAKNKIVLNTQNWSPGIYFYEIEFASKTKRLRMMIIE